MTTNSSNTEKTVLELMDRVLEGCKPSTVVLGTVAGVVGVYTVSKLMEKGQLLERMDKAKWRLVRKCLNRFFIQAQIDAAQKSITFKRDEADEDIFVLPQEGWSHEKVLDMCLARKVAYDADFSKGLCSGTVYHGGEHHTELVNKSMEIFQWSNPLHVDVFGAVRKMEAEIVQMCVEMYNGQKNGGDGCGAITSGGSESIGMAMKAARELGRFEHGLSSFSIVAPISIHPAFDKAAHYYGIDLIKVPVDPVSQKADPAVLEKYLRHDTVLIACSAPCFPNGGIDDVPAMAKLALKHGLLCHVDACLGGFIVPFLDEAGFKDHHPFDFTVKGVTSISCDTHKYGAAPKGTSVVMYSSKAIRKYQYFTCADWPGGNYASPAAAGSKPGNVIAGTWAAMMSIGRSGYVENCRKIVQTNVKLREGLLKIPSLFVIGNPNAESSVLAFSSSEIDIFDLSKKLRETGGWLLNPLQYPVGLQFSLTLLQANEETSDRFLKDVAAATAELRAELLPGEVKDGTKGSSLYGSSQRITDRTIIEDVLAGFFDKYYDVSA